MNKKSELDCYMFYMWNRWNLDDAMMLFGRECGCHIWSKWADECRRCTDTGAPAAFYSVLTSDVRQKIVERAVKYYNS